MKSGTTDDVREAEDKLLAVFQRELDNAALWSNTKLQASRADALNAYFGNARGDEREGRSQAVTRDVFEQTEWSLAFMMDTFESVERLAEFEPDGEDDVQTAEQATKATHDVFQKEGGTSILYTAIKDGFLQKNGTAKVKYMRSRLAEYERYEGKSLLEVAMLLDDPTFQARAISAYMIDETGQRQDVPAEAFTEEDQDLALLLLFDVSGVRVDSEGHVAIDNIAPENFFTNPDAKSLTHSSLRFAADRMQSTASELIAMGVPEEIVASLPTSTEDLSAVGSNAEYQARRSQENQLPHASDRTDSERPIVVYDAYVKVDLDGDGMSEWHNGLLGGEYGQVLLASEPCVGHPYAGWTPIPIPHRLNGLSFGDIVTDIQIQHTSQWRQYQDALFLATDPMYVVLSHGEGAAALPLVNLNQLIHGGPGRYVEEYAPGALRTLQHQPDASQLLPSMEQTGHMLHARTGVSPESMGLDPTKISDHVYGAAMQQNAAAVRMIMYARLFAQNFIKQLFWLIFREIQLNVTTKQMLKVNDQWQEIDPSAWTTKVGVHISLPLGHASRSERVANLGVIASIQEKLLTAGYLSMVPESQVYNTARSSIEALGFKNVSSFVLDPATAEPVEPQPTEAEKALALQQQIEALRLEIERQDTEIKRFSAMVDAKKVELDHEYRMKELDVKKAQADAQAAKAKATQNGAGGESGGGIQYDDPSFSVGAQ